MRCSSSAFDRTSNLARELPCEAEFRAERPAARPEVVQERPCQALPAHGPPHQPAHAGRGLHHQRQFPEGDPELHAAAGDPDRQCGGQRDQGAGRALPGQGQDQGVPGELRGNRQEHRPDRRIQVGGLCEESSGFEGLTGDLLRGRRGGGLETGPGPVHAHFGPRALVPAHRAAAQRAGSRDGQAPRPEVPGLGSHRAHPEPLPGPAGHRPGPHLLRHGALGGGLEKQPETTPTGPCPSSSPENSSCSG